MDQADHHPEQPHGGNPGAGAQHLKHQQLLPGARQRAAHRAAASLGHRGAPPVHALVSWGG